MTDFKKMKKMMVRKGKIGRIKKLKNEIKEESRSDALKEQEERCKKKFALKTSAEL